MSNAASAPPFRPARARTLLVALFLIANVVLSLIAIASDYLQIQIISDLMSGQEITLADAEANDSRQQMIGIAQLALFVVTAFFFLLWIHRAHKNLKALGAHGLKYSPGWAVGGFFVPIFNLVRPYQVVKEIWKASDPNIDDDYDISWQYAPASSAIGWWWTMCLLSPLAGIAGRAANGYFAGSEAPEALLIGPGVILVSDVLTVFAALFAIRVVSGIGARQRARHRQLSELLAKPAKPPELPPAPLDPEAAKEYMERGLVYASTADYDYAMAEFNRALTYNPRFAEAYYNRAILYHEKGDYSRALADYDRAIMLNAEMAEAYFNRGVLHGGRGEYQNAIADLGRAIALNPQDAGAYTSRAVAHANSGNHDLAMADLDKAITLDPQNAEAYLLRGTARGNGGDRGRAIADIHKALELGLEADQQAQAEAQLGMWHLP